jgi:hypothetical protein
LQKSLPAEADGAVHITPAAKAAAAPPTVAINTLVFMLGFLFSGRRRHCAAAGCASRIVGFQGESRRRHVGATQAFQVRRVAERQAAVERAEGPGSTRPGPLIRGAHVEHTPGAAPLRKWPLTCAGRWCAVLGLNQSRLAKRRGRFRLICYLRTFVVAWTLADFRREPPARHIPRRPAPSFAG